MEDTYEFIQKQHACGRRKETYKYSSPELKKVLDDYLFDRYVEGLWAAQHECWGKRQLPPEGLDTKASTAKTQPLDHASRY